MRNWVKQLIELSAKLAMLSDLVSGYGEMFFRAGVLLWGMTLTADWQLCLQLISAVRNGGLGREGIGTSMMMQLVDFIIDTS